MTNPTSPIPPYPLLVSALTYQRFLSLCHDLCVDPRRSRYVPWEPEYERSRCLMGRRASRNQLVGYFTGEEVAYLTMEQVDFGSKTLWPEWVEGWLGAASATP